MRSGLAALAATSTVFCSGCIGIAPRGEEISRLEKPILSADRARYVGSDTAGEFPVPTKSQVLAAWGKPDIVEMVAPGEELGKDRLRLKGILIWGKGRDQQASTPVSERWTYIDGIRWSGAWLWVVLPIPLMLPLSTNQVTVEYFGESVVAVKTVATAQDPLTVCVFGPYPPYIRCATPGQRQPNTARFISTRALLPPRPVEPSVE